MCVAVVGCLDGEEATDRQVKNFLNTEAGEFCGTVQFGKGCTTTCFI